jgi:23S rRNA pseudouridine2605 synthase
VSLACYRGRMSSQRLQKVLAQAGIASRRAAEQLITEGRVRVNGRIVRELGARANPDKDRVEVDGRRLVAQRLVYFLIHKPRGVVTTLDDPEGRKTVKDLLRDIRERVFPVGRLDFQTSGALLLTNDGELAQALLHPRRAVPKTYNAKLQGQLDETRLTLLREGVTLDDGHKTLPAEVVVLRTDEKATSVEITISEGKNRQIHRMGEAIGRTVLRLTRLSFAGLTLDSLRPGQMRQLNQLEVADLKQKYVHKAPKRRKSGWGSAAELDEEAVLLANDRAPEPEAERPARGPRASRESPRFSRDRDQSEAQLGRDDEVGGPRFPRDPAKRHPRVRRDDGAGGGRFARGPAKRGPGFQRDDDAREPTRVQRGPAKRGPQRDDAEVREPARFQRGPAKRGPTFQRNDDAREPARVQRGPAKRGPQFPRDSEEGAPARGPRFQRGPAKRGPARGPRSQRDDEARSPRFQRDPAKRGSKVQSGPARSSKTTRGRTRTDFAGPSKRPAKSPRRTKKV